MSSAVGTTGPVVFLGRCKACKATVRLAATGETRTVQVGFDFYGPRHEKRYAWTLPNGQKSPGEYARFFAACLCGKHAEFRRLFGKVGPQKCGAKCMSAKGPSCECQCGGKNHGGAFSCL